MSLSKKLRRRAQEAGTELLMVRQKRRSTLLEFRDGPQVNAQLMAKLAKDVNGTLTFQNDRITIVLDGGSGVAKPPSSAVPAVGGIYTDEEGNTAVRLNGVVPNATGYFGLGKLQQERKAQEEQDARRRAWLRQFNQ